VATPPQASEAFYKTLQSYQLLLLTAVRSLWSGVLPGNFDGSWRRIGPQVVAITAGAQLASATAGVQYVPRVLAETGQPDEPLVRIRPQAFAGVAQDGRNLGTLLEGSVRIAKRASADGATAERALELGGNWLDMAARTLAADAARDAVQAEIAVRKDMGYVRLVNPPCCPDCAVLAGKWYRSNVIMPRHENCDCQFIPASENVAGDYTTDPAELYKRGLITGLTRSQRARIDDGADITKVLNEGRDRWRERMAAQRKAAKAGRRTTWGSDTVQQPERQTIHSFLDSLVSQVEAARAMRDAGIAE
jgi:hypothetical protein